MFGGRQAEIGFCTLPLSANNNRARPRKPLKHVEHEKMITVAFSARLVTQATYRFSNTVFTVYRTYDHKITRGELGSQIHTVCYPATAAFSHHGRTMARRPLRRVGITTSIITTVSKSDEQRKHESQGLQHRVTESYTSPCPQHPQS